MSLALPPRACIRLWGVRGTVPSPGALTLLYGGNTPCVEVRTASDDLIVLDAGTGLRALGAALEVEAGDHAMHLFLSHRHLDHLMGLPHFAPLINGSRDIRIACFDTSAAETDSTVQGLLTPPLFPLLSGVADRLRVQDWRVNDSIRVPDGTRVRALAARHPGGAGVIVVEDDDGLLVAYAPDNELSLDSADSRVVGWRDALALALRGVPVLLHDATYAHDEVAAHEGWGHSSAEEATRFAVAAQAETLLLFHHHPDRTDAQVALLVSECRDLARSMSSPLHVDAATEGATLQVPALGAPV